MKNIKYVLKWKDDKTNIEFEEEFETLEELHGFELYDDETLIGVFKRIDEEINI